MEKLNFKAVTRILFSMLFVVIAFFIIINFSNVLNVKFINVITNVGFLVLFILVVLLFLSFNFIDKSINNITQYAKMLSDGKLNVKDIKIHGNNDFSMLASYINNLKSNLVYLLDQTKSNILVLSGSIEKVSMNMDMIFAENEQISSEMQEISSKSQEQLSVVTDTIAKTDEVKKSTDIINANIEEGRLIAVKADSSAKAGKKSLSNYNKNIDLISKSIENTNEFIIQLKSSACDIGNVIDFIVGLNEQLQLLALNASIQAARAGEDGKGFNVVAQEITKLSESTKEGVDKINNIVMDILKGSNNVEDSTKESIEYFENSKNAFLDVEKNFNEISKMNASLLNKINHIVSESLNINSNIKNAVMLCKKVNDSSVVVSQSTEEVVTSVEQELKEFQDINSSTAQLHLELTKIEKLVTKFELDIKPVPENPQKQLKIAVLIPPLGGVWDIINFGALYGKKVLKAKNTNVEIISINANSEDDYVNTVKRCVENKYDGVLTPGVFEEQLKYLVKENIPIITYNMDIKEKSERIVYVGENSYKSGIIAGKTMIKQIDGKGNVVLITCNIHLENFKLREEGIREAIAMNKNIRIADRLEVPLGDENVYRIVKEYLKNNTEIKGIINITAGVLGLAKAVEELNMTNKLKNIVFYDNTEKILKYINNGTITCTIGQDPFRQGYDSLIYMYNYLVKGEKIDDEQALTNVEIMDKKKAKQFLG